jgi:hypothetical protein
MAFRSLLLRFRPATIFYLLKPRRKASMRSKNRGMCGSCPCPEVNETALLPPAVPLAASMI